MLDGVGGEVGVWEEVAEGLEDVSDLQHPERRQVDKAETDSADTSRLRQRDSRFEEVNERS